MHNSFNPLSHQSESITVDYPMDMVYKAAIKASNSGIFKLKEENKLLHRLSMVTKASMFSWGETVTVQLSQKDSGTQIVVSSQPKTSIGSQGIGAQSTSGVKSKKNIDQFLQEISKYLG